MQKNTLKYSLTESQRDLIADLWQDAKTAIRQSRKGPFFNGATPESCIDYANECLEDIKRVKRGESY